MPKGHYDRAASRWQPPPRKDDPPELVAQVRELYDSGKTMKEVAAAVGVSTKVLQRLMPRHGIVRRRAVKRDQYGPSNTSWGGEEVGYQALHLRVIAARGKPNECSACGTTEPGRYHWANLTGHYRDVSDYVRMCVSCHHRFDARRRAATGTRTSPLKGVMPHA